MAIIPDDFEARIKEFESDITAKYCAARRTKDVFKLVLAQRAVRDAKAAMNAYVADFLREAKNKPVGKFVQYPDY